MYDFVLVGWDEKTPPGGETDCTLCVDWIAIVPFESEHRPTGDTPWRFSGQTTFLLKKLPDIRPSERKSWFVERVRQAVLPS